MQWYQQRGETIHTLIIYIFLNIASKKQKDGKLTIFNAILTHWVTANHSASKLKKQRNWIRKINADISLQLRLESY